MFGAAAGFVAGWLFIEGVGNADALPGGLVTAGFAAVDVFDVGAPDPPTFFIWFLLAIIIAIILFPVPAAAASSGDLSAGET